jgi:hypothetical protein
LSAVEESDAIFIQYSGESVVKKHLKKMFFFLTKKMTKLTASFARKMFFTPKYQGNNITTTFVCTKKGKV